MSVPRKITVSDPLPVDRGYNEILRAETIAYMSENYAQFQSALAMLDRMYEDLDLGVTYPETERSHKVQQSK